ncbi:MAG TPA: TIM barrel protein [archaeon]|nr:TIM barrel protein [archaeon]
MKIALTTSINTPFAHFKKIDYYIKNGFKVIELDDRWEHFQPRHIKHVQEYLKKGISFTIHSYVSNVLSSNFYFRKADEYRLFAEIVFAKEIKSKIVVMHINSALKLSKKHLSFLKKAAMFAKKNKVNLCVENGAKKDSSDPNYYFDLCKKTGLKMCVDLGHLNVALKGDLEKEKVFLKKVRPLIKHAHIHNNNGEKDEHSLLEGEKLLLLNELPKNIVLTIEVKNFELALKQKEILKEYLKI